MADTREKTKDVAGKAPGMAEKAGDQGKGGMHMISDKTKEATSGIVGTVEEKVQDMATSASQLAGKVKDTAEEWASSVGGAAIQAKDKTQEVAGAAAEKVGELGQEMTALIRRHPLPALLVGVGVGFLLAQALRHPSSPGT
jgi:predicted phage tail protein